MKLKFQCPVCRWTGFAEDMDSENEEFYGEEEISSTGANYLCPNCGFEFDCGYENYPSEEFLIDC